ncbi:acid protease [Mycena leptocephala]|nr:acid protease [Mycena leptocephala]
MEVECIQIEGQRTVTLSSVPTNHSARRARLAAPTSQPLIDYFNGTDLQWYGNVSVGTPPQYFTAVFDTGSAQFEIPGTACGSACSKQHQFNSSASSTFVDKNSSTAFVFGTGVGVTPVDGDNWVLNVSLVADTVSVAGLTVNSTDFYLITNQTPTFLSDPFDGIMGLSPTSAAFFNAGGYRAIFGMFFTPKNKGGAELTLGGVDTTKFKTPLTFSPSLVTDDWQLSSQAIYVNGKTTSQLNNTLPIYFDSGTSNVLFEESIALAIYSMISPDIIQFEGIAGHAPFNLTIPSSELSSGPFASKPHLCQTLINVSEGLNLHYYSAWDMNGPSIGFAPNGF